MRPLSRIALCLGVAAVLTACGTVSGGGSVDDPDDAPEERTADYLITSEALPTGWGDSNSQGVDYRTTVCGVDLEPTPPARATSIRFSQGPVGPFLEQHVRVYRSDVVSGVIEGLRTALPDCTEYVAKGTAPTSPSATFKVRPLVVENAPADSVAWRQTTTGRLPITSDILLVRRGNTAVLLMSYALRAKPDPKVLAGAVADLPEGA